MAESGIHFTVEDLTKIIETVSTNPDLMKAIRGQVNEDVDNNRDSKGANEIGPLGGCGIIFCGG